MPQLRTLLQYQTREPAGGAAIQVQAERKQFFFAKKNQKTFDD
jgi:hypothetical protein